ncbi:MAG: PAS domain-containing sensor histidine kinase [Bacteroidia bacterium]
MNQSVKHRLLEALFEHATESIIVVDEHGKILLVNPATEKLFGYRQKELTDKTVEFLLPQRYADKHIENRENYNKHPHARGMGIGMDLYARKKDGLEFPVEISLTPFNTEEHKHVIAFIIDITKRKKTEQEIIDKKKELEVLTKELKANNEKLETKVADRTKVLSEALIELEKSKSELSEALEKEKELNELKSRFLSMASHEFRTPLTAILSSASLIDEYKSTDHHEKRMKHVTRIKSAVNNLNDILSDFLSISKIEEGKVLADISQFNLKELADEICNEMKGLAKAGQQISFVHEGEAIIKSDKKLIRNIIINLISNAIKFSDENKPIEIKTSVDKSSATIMIRDQGMGISDEDKKHLFERFFRGHNAMNVQGTGLGLNIVANYVELLDGYIEMQSELESGTTFTITLPNNPVTKVFSS